MNMKVSSGRVVDGGSLWLLICLPLIICRHATCHTSVEPSFYSAANHDRVLYDRPRLRPKRRGDTPHKEKEPIALSRYIDYGKEGHPYERVSRLREERERVRDRRLQEDNVVNVYDREILRILKNDKLYQSLRIHFDTVSDCKMHWPQIIVSIIRTLQLKAPFCLD